MRPWIATAALLLPTLTGCTDLADYRGDFGGGAVGSDDEDCPADRTCSFIRRGFPEGTQLFVRQFDPSLSSGTPGRLSTEPYAAYDNTPLERVLPLDHDQLSLYDFPGGGRIRNFIYTARAGTGPLAGRDAVVFVSLMDNDRIEVRVVVGSGDEARGDHFGLFVLDRE